MINKIVIILKYFFRGHINYTPVQTVSMKTKLGLKVLIEYFKVLIEYFLYHLAFFIK